VAAAIHLRGQRHAPPARRTLERSDALGAPPHILWALMHQVDAVGFHIQRNFAKAWAASPVEATPISRHSAPISRHWLEGANLIVGGHHAHEHRLGKNGGAQSVEVDEAVRPRRQQGDTIAVAGQARAVSSAALCRWPW